MRAATKILLFYFISIVGGGMVVAAIYFISFKIKPFDDFFNSKEIKEAIIVLGTIYLFIWGLLNLLFFLPLWRYFLKWTVFVPSLTFIGVFLLRKMGHGDLQILLPQLGVQFFFQLFAFLKLYKNPEIT